MPELPDATALLEDFRSGTLSPLEALDAALDRIARRDPAVNAFRLVDADRAREAAARSQARWTRREPAGLLDGVPVAIKDVLLTAGWPTLRGSLAVEPDQDWDVDAPSVAALARNGAVAVGKTTTPEFGWKGVTHGPLDGVTRNPWDVTRTAGGSSGGSSAALSAGMVPLASERMAAGRSASRAGSAACPGSSPPTAGSRRGRPARSARSPTSGRWRAACATSRCCSTS